MKLKVVTGDDAPVYLKVVTAAKLHKLQHSWWYTRQRRFLQANDVALMLNTSVLPQIRFYNQDVRFEVVYKRFTINDQHLYIPIEDYAKYYIDYKMRIAACVAEMLGVSQLKYRYNEVISDLSAYEVQGGYANATAEAAQTVENNEKRAHSDVKAYDKGACDYLFVDPATFETRLKDINCYFIDSKTYDHDYDLRNLVRARLVGNLTDYALKYEVAYMSKFELKIAAFLYGSFGASLKQQSRRKLCVTLNIQFYRMEDLITTDNMNVHDNRCLQLILRGAALAAGQSPKKDLIYNFIERHLFARYSLDDRDDDNSYLAYYTFLKIADRTLLASYIQGIKSLDDLLPNGFLAVSLRSTVFAALLGFDDEGYYKLQQIYVNILRQCRGLENAQVTCFDLRCSQPDCHSPMRVLKRIFCYIMRTFNHENPGAPLTVGLETEESFARALYYIAANIIVLPSYRAFADYVSQRLEPFRFDMPSHVVIPATEGIRDRFLTPGHSSSSLTDAAFVGRG